MSIKEINNLILNLDDSDLVKYNFSDGFNIWAHVRYTVYKNLLSNKTNPEYAIKVCHKSKFVKFKEAILNYLVAYKESVILFSTNKKYDCLIFNSTAACYKAEDGFLKSRINGFFLDIRKLNVLNFYQKLNGKYANNYHQPFFYHELFLNQAELRSKIKYSNYASDIENINCFVDSLKAQTKYFLPEDFYLQIESQLMYYRKVHYYLTKYYKKLLKKFSPKFIVVEDGNYGGGDKTVLVWIANQMGIKTIEVQHGIFDIAFIYSNNLLERKEFSFFKTSMVFTMGEFWRQFCKMPSKVYTFGYPYLENKMNTISSNKSEDVVFISQGADTTFLKNIALNLRSKIPNRIIYRLHPNELVDSYVDLKENNIEVSTYGDVYELLNSVKYVIGSYSTVLIEAIMFGKKVLVHNNFYSDEFIPKQFGIRFLTVDDILDIMKIEDSYEDFDNQLWAFKSIDNLHKINEIENLW